MNQYGLCAGERYCKVLEAGEILSLYAMHGVTAVHIWCLSF